MFCYYQGCSRNPQTREHIPPKSFFPKDQRNQLLTVPSCEEHNNTKSSDDIYVLAQICMNASPSNRSRKVFIERIVPQLGYNNEALRKTLAADASPLPDGSVAYNVDLERFDKFFTALSYGIVYKSCGEQLPAAYRTEHVYHSFKKKTESPQERMLREGLLSFYSGEPMTILDFGSVKALNATVYSVKVFGVSGFKSSITIVHVFFGVFRVTSMLTKVHGNPVSFLNVQLDEPMPSSD